MSNFDRLHSMVTEAEYRREDYDWQKIGRAAVAMDAYPEPYFNSMSEKGREQFLRPEVKAQRDEESSSAKKAAHEEIEGMVEDANEKYPELELSLGYIGNFEFGKDDTSWYVWPKGLHKLTEFGSGKNWRNEGDRSAARRLSYQIGGRDSFPKEVERMRDHFPRWVERTMDKYFRDEAIMRPVR